MKSSFLAPVLFVLAFLAAIPTMGQTRFNVTTQLVMKGYVFSMKGKPVKGSKVVLKSGTKVLKTITPDKKGFFELELAYDKLYTIHFSAPETVSEFIEVDTKGLDNIENTYSYEYQLKIRLRKPMDGIDYSMFEEAILKIHFDHDLEAFVRDEAYDKAVEEKMQEMYKGDQ